MSLIAFHRLLISAGIAFCLGFGAWEIRAFTRDRQSGAIVLGAVFLLLGIALIIYLRRLNRILGYAQEERD